MEYPLVHIQIESSTQVVPEDHVTIHMHVLGYQKVEWPRDGEYGVELPPWVYVSGLYEDVDAAVARARDGCYNAFKVELTVFGVGKSGFGVGFTPGSRLAKAKRDRDRLGLT